MTFDELAETVLLTRWKPYHDRLIPADLPILRRILSETLRDLFFITHFKKTERELVDEGDSGLLKIAKVIRPVTDHPHVAERYSEARVTQDIQFTDALQMTLRQPAIAIDPRTLLGPKAFLYLNWQLPLLNPELDQGLMVRTIPEIHGLLEQDSNRRWSEDGVKKELKRLRLLPRDEETKTLAGSARISDFLTGGIQNR